MPRKTRPPRIRKDKKGYYLIQNRVKRYIDDPKKLKEAVEKGELAYKTSKKSPLWQETFKPVEPINMDPLERRKIEKARWDIYNAAVERYKKEVADYQKKQVELSEINKKKQELKDKIDANEVKFNYPLIEKYDMVKGDVKEEEIGIGLTDDQKEELAQRIEENNKKLEAIEAELNDEYEKNLASLRKGVELQQKYLDEDIKTTGLETSAPDDKLDNLRSVVDRINKNNAAIIEKLDELKKKYGVVKFYEFRIPDMVFNDELKELNGKRIELAKEYDKLVGDIKNPDRPIELKTSNEYEKKIIAFLMSMTAKDLLRYAYEIHHARFTNKGDAINAMLADPKTSKIIMLAYEEYLKKPGQDFFEISARISKSVVGFGSGDDYDGLYGDEILKIMKPYKGFLGVIMNDEIPDIIESSLHWDRFGFVINKDNHNMEGSHWCAVFVDIPDGSVEYYDSFGEEPTDEVKRDLMELIKEHEINYLMKFKVNGVKVQDLRTGSCGWFAMKFLIDRFNGVPFDRASGFNITGVGVKKAEASIKKMKKGFGYI